MFKINKTTIRMKYTEYISILLMGSRGHDHMVVGFTTLCATGAYHHESCEFKPRSLCDKVCQ